MKINKREKKLISSLCILVVAVLFYKFIFSPLSEKIIETKTNLQIKQMEYTSVMANIDSKERLIKEYENITKSFDDFIYGYFTHIEDEQIVLLIKELSKDSNVTINSMDLSVGKVINIDEVVFEGTTVDLNITAGYLEVTEFIRLIETYPKKIVVNSLSMYSQSNQLSSFVSLDFYAITSVTENREDIYIIEKDSNESNNPFN